MNVRSDKILSCVCVCVCVERLFLMFLDHTQRRSTVGKTPLEECSARRRDLYLTTHDSAPYIYDISSLRVNDLTLILLTWRKW